jgi:hypothetical protein
MRFVSFAFVKALAGIAVIGGTACSATDEPKSESGNGRHSVRLQVAAITCDGAPLSSGYVVRRRGVAVDSVPLTASGTATLDQRSGDTLLLSVVPTATDRYYASIGTLVVGGDTAVDVVMIPTSWTVQRGRYAGAKRAIDIIKAIGSDADDTHFLDHFTPVAGMLVGWTEDDLPITVGYDTTATTRRWTPADSSWFWSALLDINDAMGRTIFRPATNVALSTPKVVSVRVDYETPSIRQGSIGTNLDICKPPLRGCDAVHGVVTLGSSVFFRSRFDDENFLVMQHEMMHVLGFGHACYWPSVVMRTGPDCAPTVPNDITVDDAAYIEFVLRLGTVLEAHPYAWNLDEALTGARIRGSGQ